MPLAPLEWSSATDDNQHMKNPDINVAEIATESTDEKIKQFLTVDTSVAGLLSEARVLLRNH